MNIALHKVRAANVWVSTGKAATMVGRDCSWVQKNKERFEFKRPKSRNLFFELTSVLKVQEELQKS